jgi:hypothetical protein
MSKTSAPAAKKPPVPTPAQPQTIFDVPLPIRRRVRAGWIASLVLGVLLSGQLIQHPGSLPAPWMTAMVPFMMAYGIARFSRVCAWLMLLFVLGLEVMVTVQTGLPRSLLPVLVFMACFLFAIRGTHLFHQWRRSTLTPRKR